MKPYNPQYITNEVKTGKECIVVIDQTTLENKTQAEIGDFFVTLAGTYRIVNLVDRQVVAQCVREVLES